MIRSFPLIALHTTYEGMRCEQFGRSHILVLKSPKKSIISSLFDITRLLYDQSRKPKIEIRYVNQDLLIKLIDLLIVKIINHKIFTIVNEIVNFF